MPKRRVQRLLASLVLVSALLGCGGDDEESDAPIEDVAEPLDTADGAEGDAPPAGDTTVDPDVAHEDVEIDAGDEGDAGDDGEDAPPPVDLCPDDVDCDDGDPCTEDTCNPVVGCLHAPKDCDDGDACTVDQCEPETGSCTYSARSCDDSNDCTVDACDSAVGCKYTLVSCDDGDPCTLNSCAPATGQCQSAPNPCNDGDPCTEDTCDPELGCVHEPKEGPCCVTAADCDDGQACTTDACVDGLCSNLPIPGCCTSNGDCDTGNPCVEEQCQAGKCLGKPVSGPGCCTAAAQCDDGDPCTATGCAANQCVSQSLCCASDLDCPSGGCAAGACAESIGCYSLVTDETCCEPVAWAHDFGEFPQLLQIGNALNGVGWHLASAPDAPTPGVALRYGVPGGPGYSGPGGPHKGSASTPWFSLPPGEPLELRADLRLDVRSPSTQDIVQVRVQHGAGQVVVWQKPAALAAPSWQTLAIPMSAFAGQTIRLVFYFDSVNTPPTLGTGVWLAGLHLHSDCAAVPCATTADCNDGVAFSLDQCLPETGTCRWSVSPTWCDEVKLCNDGDPCTQNLCLNNACVFQPIVGCCAPGDPCDDGNPCTEDACAIPGAQASGTCTHTPIPGCCTQVSQCDDGDPCTVDDCDTGALVCLHDPVPECCSTDAACDDGDPCTENACVALSCVSQEVCCVTDEDCDDGDPICTLDACVDGFCVFEPTHAPECCSEQVAFFAFDTPDEPKWTFVNSAGPALGWQVWTSPPSSQSPPAVLYYGDPVAMNFEFGGVANMGTATSPPMSLLPDAAYELRLWLRMDTESGSSYDKLTIYVREGAQTYPVWVKGNITPGTWFQVVANLNAFAGRTVQIELVFDTVDGIANSTLGVLVDDVSVTSSCAPVPCVSALDCEDGNAFSSATCPAGACVYSL